MKVNTVIIGAGISGLSTANFLSKKTSDFVIIESSNRVGGTINSSKVDGYIIENGPNTVLDNNTAIQELLSDLSITDKLIYPDLKKISSRYLLINDKLEKIPLTIIGGCNNKHDMTSALEKYGLLGLGAGSLFSLKGKYRAVLIQYFNSEDKK